MSTSRLDVLLAETGLDASDRRALVALEEMLALVPDEAPRPSAKLQAVLDGGPSIPGRPGHPLRAGVVAGLVSVAATVGIGGVVAAANELPPGMQRVVSEWSQQHLPFTFPMPERSSGPTSVPRHSTPSATALPARPLATASTTPTLGAGAGAGVGARDTDTGATPAARPGKSSSAPDHTSTAGGRRAGGSSRTPSLAGTAPRRAEDHSQEQEQEQKQGPPAEGGGASGSKHEHPTGRPSDVPSAQAKRQDAEHRADAHGNSSGHRRMTQSRRDRRPDAH